MITYEKIPLEQANIDKLRTLFASPEFALLKSVIGAQATERTVQFSNSSLYESDAAVTHAAAAKAKAVVLNNALDVLDEFEAGGEWFTIKLDQRR